MLPQQRAGLQQLQRRTKSRFVHLQHIHGEIKLSHDSRLLLKATAFIFGISSVNLYGLYSIFRKYIRYQRYENEVAAIKQMNERHNKIQNHLSISSSKSQLEQILFPAFLRPKYSENSHQHSEVVLGVSSPSNYKQIHDSDIFDDKIHSLYHHRFKQRNSTIYTMNRRCFTSKIVIDPSHLMHSNALYLNTKYKERKQYRKHEKNESSWEERKTLNYNNDVIKNDFRNMRLRQITQCFDEINTYNNHHNDAMNYFDYDYKENQEEEYMVKSHSLKEYNYTNNYAYLNNNYDDDHLNLFAIHDFIQRIVHRDQHGNVVLRVSREWERPSILKQDDDVLRYYIDIYYARFNIIANMMLDFKYFVSEFKKILKSYFHAKDVENKAVLSSVESQVYKRHSQLTLLKNDIYKHIISYCDALRIPDELLTSTEHALELKEELLSEILPLYFLSGISDIPLQTTSNQRINYDEHLRVLFDYFSHKLTLDEEYHKQTLDEYINIISRLVKLEDYDEWQHSVHDNFNSFPKLSLHLLSILECKYSTNLFPRTCYRIIRTLCKKIELFGCYSVSNNELLRISLKKLSVHSPEFFNNLSFYQLLSMCYINSNGNYNHFIMDNICNKLLEMKYKMLGGTINSADLSFLCNNEYIMYWLNRIIDEYKGTDLITLKSMELSLPVSVLGYDGLLFILLKYFDTKTYLNQNNVSIKIIEIIDDILCLFEHNKQHNKHKKMEHMHWTLCCALNFIIKKCGEFGNKSNGLIFDGKDMLLIMDKISSINNMIYDVSGIKRALSLTPNDLSADGYDGFINSWFNILNKENTKLISCTWLMLPLSSSVSVIEKYHYSLFSDQLKRNLKYSKKIDYRCLHNIQSDLSPIIFFSKQKHQNQSELLRRSAATQFALHNNESHNIYDIIAEGMMMNLNHGKDLYKYFVQKHEINGYKLWKHKLDHNDLFNIIPFFNNLMSILPIDRFGMFEIGKLLTLFRKRANVDLSLSLFDSLSFKKKYGNIDNELFSILILTLIENGRVEDAKYWIHRYLSIYPILCQKLIDTFFNHYLTYNMTSNRSRRCQGRDRQKVKAFYDDLIINHFRDENHRNINLSFDKLLLYSLEYAPHNLKDVVSNKDIPLNTYKSKTECIDEVIIHLMTNNEIQNMSLLLRDIYLNGNHLLNENIEIIVRSFLPIIRFLANNDEYKLINELFNIFDEYNGNQNKQYSIPITTQKLELLFDDNCANLPVLKDFHCLKKSEYQRNNNANNKHDIDHYYDPSIDVINLWKDFYFNNRHTNTAMMNKIYHYFNKKDKLLFDNSYFLVSKDINIRFAHYFMMDIMYNDAIFNDNENDIKQNRKNKHFRDVLKGLLKEHYPDSYIHCDKFSKEQQTKDLQTVLRQL